MEPLVILSVVLKALQYNTFPAIAQIIADWSKDNPTLDDIENLKNRLPVDGNIYFE